MSVLPLGVAVLIVLATVARLQRRGARRSAGLREQQRTVDVLRGLSGELQAGASPAAALAAVAADDEQDREVGGGAVARGPVARGAVPLGEVARAARAPTDLEAAAVLRAGPTAGLRALGACWQLSARCGTPLADASQRLAAVATRRSATAAEVRATLAGPG